MPFTRALLFLVAVCRALTGRTGLPPFKAFFLARSRSLQLKAVMLPSSKSQPQAYAYVL
jgi:hypothetical protein